MRAFILAAIFLSTTLPLGAQVRVEAFVHTGVMEAVADEGSLGRFAPYGGAAAFLLKDAIVLEIDFQIGEVSRKESTPARRWRRLQLTPGVFYRWRTQDKVSPFAGGGLGLHEERIRLEIPSSAVPPPNSREVGPGLYEVARISRYATNVRGGLVVNVTEHWLIRPEAGVWFAYGPRITAGMRAGIGYRF